MTLNLLKTSRSSFHEQIGWSTITAEIIEFHHFQAAAKKFYERPTLIDFKSIEKAFDTIEYISTKILEKNSNFFSYLSSNKQQTNIWEKLKKESFFSLKELNEVAKYIEFYWMNRKIIHEAPFWSDFQIDSNHVGQLNQLVFKKIRQLINKDGEIQFLSHPLLNRPYLELLKIEERLKLQVNHLITLPLYKDVLQFKEYDKQNGYYILPIRTDAYQAKHGHIVDRSSSGMTLYVRPRVLDDLSKKQNDLQDKIDEVLEKLACEFSKLIWPYKTIISKIKDVIYYLDYSMAKALYVNKYQLKRPQLSHRPKLEIHDFYHPLLTDAVTNSIELNENLKIFILSGANTGGKSTALKAIALCQLFLVHGMFIPAKQASLYPFEGIYYFGLDQQDLGQGLSSFSSEVKYYLQLLKEFESNNIILIDEIFNSTSSEEASALAIGLINELKQVKNNFLIVSTHHQDLKTWGHQHSDILSGHVSLSGKEQLPTYKIKYGDPGSSMALSIFSNWCDNYPPGMEIVRIAKNFLGNKSIKYDQLISRLHQKESQLEHLINENKLLNEKQIKAKNEYNIQLEHQKKTIIKDYQNKMKNTLKRIEDYWEDLQRNQLDFQEKKKLKRKIEVEVSHLAKQQSTTNQYFFRPQKELSSSSSLSYSFKEGESYLFKPLNKKATIIRLNNKKQEAFIQCGPMQFKCKFDDLKQDPQLGQGTLHFNIEKSQSMENVRLERDLRGLRLDEFQSEVYKAVSDLTIHQLPHVLIIHGHGNGTLKNWLRKWLKSQDQFRWEVPEDGLQDGTTRIFI